MIWLLVGRTMKLVVISVISLWGGPTALGWTEKKLRQAGEELHLHDAWTIGHKALGTKLKNGRTVPNCIPIEILLKLH